MINLFCKTTTADRLAPIDKFQPGALVILSDPKEAEIDKIVSLLKVEKSLLTDSLDQYEMPRLEVEDGIIYIYVRVPEKVAGDIITFPLLITIGPDFILTVSEQKCGLLNNFISGRTVFHSAEKMEFILKLFLALNEKYHFYIIDINKRLRSIKLRLKKIDVKDIIQFVDFEQVLNDFLSSLVPLNAVFQKILGGRYIDLKEEDKDLAEDIVLGNSQLIELSKSYLRYAVNIKDTHSNIATHELNRVIKLLTVITILLSMSNMVFSFFGMNVPMPFFNQNSAYIVIFATTFLTLGVLSFILIKKKWF
jgi:magnesium transporter